MWINSLGVDDLHINNLFEDSTDGLTLLKVLDFIHGGGPGGLEAGGEESQQQVQESEQLQLRRGAGQAAQVQPRQHQRHGHQ